MGAEDFEVIGKVVIDDTGNAIITGLDQKLAGLTSTASGTMGGISALGVAFGNFLGNMATQAVNNLSAAFQSMVTGFVSGGNDLELAIRRTNALIIATGDASGLTGQQVRDLAMQYRDLFGGSELVAQSAENILLRFRNLNSTEYPQAIKLVADMAATGMDAASAARFLGQMLEEPGTAAGRLAYQFGVVLLPAQRKALQEMTAMGDIVGAQKILMDALSGALSGQAAALAATASGQWAIFTGHIASAGQEISLHFQPILEKLLSVATPILDGLLKVFENTFIPLIDNASAWGEAIINALSSGMQSAFASVEAVIQELGNMLAGWLAPGSPPKFLPLLDVWGREAVDVYLKGWTTFDKSVFDEIGKAIQAGLQPALIMAYATEEHKLYDANMAVADAQDVLTAATAKYNALLDPLNEKLAALSFKQEQAKDASDIAALTVVASSTFYDASQRKQALLEIEKIKLKERIDGIKVHQMVETDKDKQILTAAQQRQKDIAEEVKLLKNQIDIQAEQTKHINQTTAAVHHLHGALASLAGLGGGAGPLGGLASKLDHELEQIRKNIEDKANALRIRIQQFFGGIQEAIARVGDLFKPIRDALDAHHKDWTRALAAIRGNWDTLWNHLKSYANLVSPEVTDVVRQFVDDVAALINGLGDQIKNGNFGKLGNVISTILDGAMAIVAILSIKLLGLLLLFLDVVGGKWKKAGDDWETTNTRMTAVLDKFMVNHGIDLAKMGAQWAKFYDDVERWTGEVADKIAAWIAALNTSISVELTKIMNNFVLWEAGNVLWLLGEVDKWKSAGTALMQGLIDGVASMAQSLIDKVSAVVGGAIAHAKALLGITSPSGVFAEIGMNMMAGMAAGMLGSAGLAQSAFSSSVSQISNNTVSNQNINMNQNIYSANISGGMSTNFSLLRAKVGV